jgi:hypothetical protein
VDSNSGFSDTGCFRRFIRGEGAGVRSRFGVRDVPVVTGVSCVTDVTGVSRGKTYATARSIASTAKPLT